MCNQYTTWGVPWGEMAARRAHISEGGGAGVRGAVGGSRPEARAGAGAGVDADADAGTTMGTNGCTGQTCSWHALYPPSSGCTLRLQAAIPHARTWLICAPCMPNSMYAPCHACTWRRQLTITVLIEYSEESLQTLVPAKHFESFTADMLGPAILGPAINGKGRSYV